MQPLATWNPEKDYWETPNTDLFGHSAAYSETFQKSGMTRNGQLYESATWEDATTVPASSSSPHLPTPAASDFKRHEESPADGKRKSPGITAVSVHFPEGQKNLPAPDASMGTQGVAKSTETGESVYGAYEAAVHRWEQVTRPAPLPTESNSKGKPRLNAQFAEWMMGLPEGWVTNPEIGLTRAQQLKAIGNGVCIPQAVAALTHLLERTATITNETAA